MLFNYLKIAYRSLRKRPGPTLINVAGLSVGLAACILIGLWVHQEFNYDRFHPDADRIYRVAIEAKISGDDPRSGVSLPSQAAQTLADLSPQVESVTRLRYYGSTSFVQDNQPLQVDRTWAADSTFFDVFGGFDLLHGSPGTALTDTRSVVLTASKARSLFGRTDVVGRSLRANDQTYQVTGVMADVPETSHFPIDALVSLDRIAPVFQDNWTGFGYPTYVKLRPDADLTAFQRSLDAMVEDYAMSDVQDRFDIPREQILYRFFPEALPSIHLFSTLDSQIDRSGSIERVYTFVAVGLFILLIACINFMNLATARASERSTEVGMRKALGAGRPQLARQFFGEAILTTGTATAVAFALASAFMPLFNTLAGTSFAATRLLNAEVLAGAGGLAVVVGLVAGSYPALALSRFAPAVVLKGSGKQSSNGPGRHLRQGLVVCQFAISIVLIMSTLVAWQQFSHIQSKRLGLEKERVVELQDADELGDRQAAFVDRIRRLPGVEAAGAGGRLFRGETSTGFLPTDAQSDQDFQSLNYYVVGPAFIETMNIDVMAGRSFQDGRATDSMAVVLNRAAVEAFGWTPQQALQKAFEGEEESPDFPIIGVTDNFHYESMRQRVRPLALLMRSPTEGQDRPSSIFARLAPGATTSAIDAVRSAWQAEAPQTPFQYSFLDQTYGQIHRSVRQTSTLFGVMASLALIIACLGLFGLATFTVQQRAKEIGIRKALGATAAQVVFLLSKQFLTLIGVAAAVGLPVAYYAMNEWLQAFAYRITPGAGLLLSGIVLTAVVAFVAVGAKAFRAAHLDPATTLRDE